MSDVEIRLNDRPDGFGFIHGQARRGDTMVHVNILPPEPLWSGSIMLEEHQPDPTHWQVFVDGELIARIERQEDVRAALMPLLAAR